MRDAKPPQRGKEKLRKMVWTGNIARRYRRWCHRRGFGVHSPFAYRFVRDIIRTPAHYYAVVRFRRHVAPLPLVYRKEYALLFRLVARMAPEHIMLAGSVEMQLPPLLYLADSRAIFSHQLTDCQAHTLTILSSTDLRRTVPHGLLADGNILVIRELTDYPQALGLMLEMLKGGWVFHDSRMAILVSNSAERLNLLEVKML